MSDAENSTVPRTPDEPTLDQVFNAMEPCEPYTVSDFENLFEDVSRWTIQRRLDQLHKEGRIQKKKHAENRVSWYIN